MIRTFNCHTYKKNFACFTYLTRTLYVIRYMTKALYVSYM